MMQNLMSLTSTSESKGGKSTSGAGWYGADAHYFSHKSPPTNPVISMETIHLGTIPGLEWNERDFLGTAKCNFVGEAIGAAGKSFAGLAFSDAQHLFGALSLVGVSTPADNLSTGIGGWTQGNAQHLLPRSVAEIIRGPWIRREYDKLIAQIERLRDGWAGPDTSAPSISTMRDLKKLVVTLQAVACLPVVEVDSDGSVDLIWSRQNGTFSLSVGGGGFVFGVLIEPGTNYTPWQIAVDDEVSIAELIENDCVAPFVKK